MQIDDNADSWLTCIACCILINFKQYGYNAGPKINNTFQPSLRDFEINA